jgi:foldase protein PrsA
MRRVLATTCLASVLLAGCAKQEPERSDTAPLGSQHALTSDKRDSDVRGSPIPENIVRDPSQPVARVNNMPITMAQLQGPLVEAYGLQILLHLAQLEVCRQKAAGAGVEITQKDVDDERQRTLESLFKDAVHVETIKGSAEEKEQFRQKEYQRLLEMFLQNQRISRPEFELATRTNAYLRKLAEQGVREQITEEHLREGFNVMYGEKVRVRHIQLNDMREAIKAKSRLNDGEPFDQVAREMSRDERTRANGGLVPRPFTRNDPTWPEAFKEAAFALEAADEVSDPVLTGDTVHLIKLEQKVPPSTAVKYESHRDIVREELIKGMIIVRMQQFREQIQDEARRTLEIHDPVLKRRYQDELERVTNRGNIDPDLAKHQMNLDQQVRSTTQPTTQPAGTDRPPATKPAQ